MFVVRLAVPVCGGYGASDHDGQPAGKGSGSMYRPVCGRTFGAGIFDGSAGIRKNLRNI